MDKQIDELVKELGVTVVYDDFLEDNAKYLPILDIIVVNNRLNDFEKKKSLLHELGHVCEDKNNYELYKKTYSLRSKMESSANAYMINYIINEHDGYFNYSQLIEEFDIGMGYDIHYAR